MAQAASFLWLVVGASRLAVVTHVAIPPATWLALTFLLHASRSMPAVPGILWVWIAVYAALAVGNRGILPVSGPAYFAIVAGYAVTVILPFGLDRFASPRIGGLGATMIFPMAFVAAEFLQSRFSPGATWGSLAYTQYGYLPLMQVAAFVGIWGLTFLVAWFASTVDWAWSHSFEWSAVRTPVLAFLVVFGAIVLGGSVRLALAPTDRPSLRTATLNRPVDLFSGRDDADCRRPCVAGRARAVWREADPTPRLVSGRQPA
jgi:apolipoprotein N-acyltransferase